MFNNFKTDCTLTSIWARNKPLGSFLVTGFSGCV